MTSGSSAAARCAGLGVASILLATLVVSLLATMVVSVSAGTGAGPDRTSEDAVLIFDFSQADTAAEWYSIGDQVMGGVSVGRMRAGDGAAVFEGEVSLENNGGFFSVRSEPRELDLSGFDGIALRVRGDGQRYKLGLKMNSRVDGIVYRAPVEPPEGEWTTVRVPFDAFQPVFRGFRVRGAPPLAPEDVRSVGLLIGDKQAGAFRLEVAWIGAYAAAATDSAAAHDTDRSPTG